MGLAAGSRAISRPPRLPTNLRPHKVTDGNIARVPLLKLPLLPLLLLLLVFLFALFVFALARKALLQTMLLLISTLLPWLAMGV